MIYLEDVIKKPRKSNPDKFDTLYRCSCDSCGADRGYLDKCRAKKLCKSCSGKISHSSVSKETREKMSKSKIGKAPWNRGEKASLESRIKMSKARKGKTPWNKGINNTPECLKSRYRHLLRKAVFKQIVNDDFLPYIGCSSKTLIKHIESQFDNSMTWNNYGVSGWHLDHVVPLRHFDLTDEEQLKVACNYRNVQPLKCKQNLKKHKRTVYLLTGAPGAGKSWVCANGNEIIDFIDLDIVKRSKLEFALKKSYRPVIAMTVGVSTFIKNNPDLDIKLVVIIEKPDTIRERLHKRNGVWNNTIERRIKRMDSLSKYAAFTGTSDEVLSFLNKAQF